MVRPTTKESVRSTGQRSPRRWSRTVARTYQSTRNAMMATHSQSKRHCVNQVWKVSSGGRS
ncbi:hypothetical protein ACFFX0_13155 [Citricoccus parietis]|uniref:Uncharacterized protein n=1 Tax=Citricoccus parietis TaxID=592307 RepID=A0ABV5FZK1_9MICC